MQLHNFVIILLVGSTLACQSGMMSGTFPLSFNNPVALSGGWTPPLQMCNDPRMADGAPGCPSLKSQMTWGSPGFAPAACSPRPGASAWILEQTNMNADGVTSFLCSAPHAIGKLSHQNLLISQNPRASAEIHMGININGLQQLEARWHIVHDETTNWFLSNGCLTSLFSPCCGASCGSTTCNNCADRFPIFCRYGGDPCGPGCYDAVGFTTEYPLRYTWNNVQKVAGHPDINPNCEYSVSVWWDVQQGQPIKNPDGSTLFDTNGILVTREGEVTSANLNIEVTTVCRSCPACPPCQTCVNFACVDDPAAFARCDKCSTCNRATGGCMPDPAKVGACNKCQQCDPGSGSCVDNPAVVGQCNKCQLCDGGSGQCVTNTALVSRCDQCSQCDPGSGNCVPVVAKFTACTSNDQCSTCNPATGGCMADPVKTNCADRCTKCNPSTGQCDTQTGVCDDNMCFRCAPDSGKCDIFREELTCGLENMCFKCDNTTGCYPTELSRLCNPCQKCDPQLGCVLDTSLCAGDRCFTCNPDDEGRCTKPRDPFCKTNCSGCNPETGSCDIFVNQTCYMDENEICRAAFCDATGQCVLQGDPLNIGARCKDDEPCRRWKCLPDGTCDSEVINVNSTCPTTETVDSCHIAVCLPSGDCGVIPKANFNACPTVDAPTANVDRNYSLCRRSVCVDGKCVYQPLQNGVNCTHRKNESDLEERICDYSICIDGFCTWNSTLSACFKKSKTKVGLIAALAGGAAALVLAALAVGIFMATRSATPVGSGGGADPMTAGLLQNPIYASSPGAGENPMYSGM